MGARVRSARRISTKRVVVDVYDIPHAGGWGCETSASRDPPGIYAMTQGTRASERGTTLARARARAQSSSRTEVLRDAAMGRLRQKRLVACRGWASDFGPRHCEGRETGSYMHMPLSFGFQITSRTMLATASRPVTRPVAGKGSVEPGALRARDMEDEKTGEGSQGHTGSWQPANLDIRCGA